MRRFLHTCLLAAACAGVLTPSLASAQQADDVTRSAARDIGTAGVEAYQAGDFAGASDKLEKAYVVLKVPSLGLWSARALAKVGNLVAAAERYREVMRLPVTEGDAAVQKQAQTDAASDLATLTPRIPSIVIQISGTPSKNLKLRVDGKELSWALVAEKCPVDPGTHVVEAELNGQVARADVVVAEGESKPAVLNLQQTPSESQGSPQASPVASAGRPPAGHGLGTQKTVAIVAGGVGLVGVAVGSIFGLASKSNHDTARSKGCSGDVCSSDAGLTAANSAYRDGNISTIAFVVGAVGLAGGATLWLTAGSTRTEVGAAPGMIQIRRAW